MEFISRSELVEALAQNCLYYAKNNVEFQKYLMRFPENVEQILIKIFSRLFPHSKEKDISLSEIETSKYINLCSDILSVNIRLTKNENEIKSSTSASREFEPPMEVKLYASLSDELLAEFFKPAVSSLVFYAISCSFSK